MAYELSRIKDQVDFVRHLYRPEFAEIDKRYLARQRYRKENKLPVLAFLGYGRCGKDIGAEWLGTNYHMGYAGSTSDVVAPFVACANRVSTADALESRHNHREYWYHFCNELRKNDPTFLVKALLSKGDILAGLRGGLELDSALSQGLIDLSIWVDRPGTPVDPTVDFAKQDCDVVILNDTTKMSYFAKLRRLASLLQLPLKETVLEQKLKAAKAKPVKRKNKTKTK